MKPPARFPKPTANLPVLAPPVRRDGPEEAGRQSGGPGVVPARSACSSLTGPARSMCYAAL
ncbi:hypothetical protein ACFU7Z_37970 [Kitasatospora sp. NPDC057518]|uniref:hypothetical protein n=1 Tax=Kitasatospora TaxID=2063 RepID=UPI0011C3509D|nr:hypothetical protein [Kitasatospora xanthocidica]